MASVSVSVGPSDRAISFDHAAQNHYGQVQGCLNMISLIGVKEDQTGFDTRLREHLTEPQQEELREIMLEAAKVFGQLGPKLEPSKFEISSTGRDPEVFATFQRIMLGATKQVTVTDRSQLLQRSVLIILVSGFETLMSDLAAAIIRENPGIASLETAKLSLAELHALGSVAEAAEHLTSKYVEDLARGSIEDWVKWFDKSGVKLNEIPAGWAQFREIFARRNLYVHTDGRVSSQYIDTMVSAGAKAEDIAPKDSKITVNNEYLQQSCELLMAAGTLLATSVWMKLRPSESSLAVQWSLGVLERALDDRNFQACVHISDKMLRVVGTKANLVTVCRLKTANWTARMLAGDTERVAAEVRGWDVGGIDLVYSHVRSVLLANDEHALDEISTLVRTGRLAKVDVLSSVLYQGLRERQGQRFYDALDVEHLGLKILAEGGEPSLEIAP